MKINPDSPDFLSRIDSTGGAPKSDRVFGGALTGKTSTAGAQPLATIAQSISKSDLADPSKANDAVDRAVHEMMDREFGGMATVDREKVASWLRSDPLIRDALLRQLNSLAS